MANMEAVVPTVPRNGQFLAVYGKSDTEGGGDIRIEVEECGTCYAVVSTARLAEHEGRHEAEAGAAPKSKL